MATVNDPYIIVVAKGDNVFLRHLGGFPTPRLIDECNDGKPHEAWPNKVGDTIQWRARDDEYDRVHKPADVPYQWVRVGRNPAREDYS